MKSMYLILFLCLLAACQGSTDSNEKSEAAIQATAKKRKAPELHPDRYNVAFLIMDGVYNTELTAPYDIFQHTQYRENIRAMNVFTVANTLDPVITFEGMKLLPDFNYTRDSLPNIDILVIPSAEHHLDTDLKDKAMIEFVKKVDEDALFMTSHCDGAFVLAQAGVLAEKVATTFPADVDKMRAMFPELDIREGVWFVHDGKYITSAGGARSFEAALYLAEHLYGAEIARSLAKGLVIDWKLEEVPHLVVD